MNPDKMSSAGFNSLQVVSILGDVRPSVVIAGTTQSDATIIKDDISILTSGTGGARLPRPSHSGHTVEIYNQAGAAATIYPTLGGKINGGLTNAGVVLSSGFGTILKAINSLDWYEFTNSSATDTDIVGPASSTDNAAARFDATTGKILQDGVVLIGDTGIVTGVLDLTATGALQGATVVATTGVTTGTITASGLVNDSAAGALTAVGTDRATSLALTKNWNNLTSVASGTGVTLPAATAGRVIGINNAGANVCKVYGAGTDTIDGAAAATGVDLTNAKRCLYICFVAGAWISAQLGVVSA